jgi:hypothetical protein
MTTKEESASPGYASNQGVQVLDQKEQPAVNEKDAALATLETLAGAEIGSGFRKAIEESPDGISGVMDAYQIPAEKRQQFTEAAMKLYGGNQGDYANAGRLTEEQARNEVINAGRLTIEQAYADPEFDFQKRLEAAGLNDLPADGNEMIIGPDGEAPLGSLDEVVGAPSTTPQVGKVIAYVSEKQPWYQAAYNSVAEKAKQVKMGAVGVVAAAAIALGATGYVGVLIGEGKADAKVAAAEQRLNEQFEKRYSDLEKKFDSVKADAEKEAKRLYEAELVKVNAKSTELSELDQKLAARDQQLADRDKELADRDKALEARDQQIKNKELAAKNAPVVIPQKTQEELDGLKKSNEKLTSDYKTAQTQISAEQTRAEKNLSDAKTLAAILAQEQGSHRNEVKDLKDRLAQDGKADSGNGKYVVGAVGGAAVVGASWMFLDWLNSGSEAPAKKEMPVASETKKENVPAYVSNNDGAVKVAVKQQNGTPVQTQSTTQSNVAAQPKTDDKPVWRAPQKTSNGPIVNPQGAINYETPKEGKKYELADRKEKALRAVTTTTIPYVEPVKVDRSVIKDKNKDVANMNTDTLIDKLDKQSDYRAQFASHGDRAQADILLELAVYEAQMAGKTDKAEQLNEKLQDRRKQHFAKYNADKTLINRTAAKDRYSDAPQCTRSDGKVPVLNDLEQRLVVDDVLRKYGPLDKVVQNPFTAYQTFKGLKGKIHNYDHAREMIEDFLARSFLTGYQGRKGAWNHIIEMQENAKNGELGRAKDSAFQAFALGYIAQISQDDATRASGKKVRKVAEDFLKKNCSAELKAFEKAAKAEGERILKEEGIDQKAMDSSVMLGFLKFANALKSFVPFWDADAWNANLTWGLTFPSAPTAAQLRAGNEVSLESYVQLSNSDALKTIIGENPDRYIANKIGLDLFFSSYAQLSRNNGLANWSELFEIGRNMTAAEGLVSDNNHANGNTKKVIRGVLGDLMDVWSDNGGSKTYVNKSGQQELQTLKDLQKTIGPNVIKSRIIGNILYLVKNIAETASYTVTAINLTNGASHVVKHGKMGLHNGDNFWDGIGPNNGGGPASGLGNGDGFWNGVGPATGF